VTPHLIHVGFPKTGSTLLQHWFEAHPQLDYAAAAAVPEGEARWCVTSSELLTAPANGAGSTQAVPNRDGLGSIAAELAEVSASLAKTSPGARILIVTRGFRSMVLSSYSQYVRTGGTQPLEWVLARAAEHRPWDYDAVIAAYRRDFGEAEVLVLPYELLVRDREAFTGRIATWLGIESRPLRDERVNPSLSPAELAWYPRLTALFMKRPLRPLRSLYLAGLMVNRWSVLVSLLQRLMPKPPVTAAMIPDERLEPFRTCAQRLGNAPDFAEYADEYLCS